MMKIWLRTGQGYNNVSCWEGLVVISNLPAPRYSGGVRPLCYAQENNILLYVDEEGVFLYDMKRGEFHKKHKGHSRFIHRVTMISYVDSLFLPGVGDKPKRKWLKTLKHDLQRSGTAQTSDGQNQMNK